MKNLAKILGSKDAIVQEIVRAIINNSVISPKLIAKKYYSSQFQIEGQKRIRALIRMITRDLDMCYVHTIIRSDIVDFNTPKITYYKVQYSDFIEKYFSNDSKNIVSFGHFNRNCYKRIIEYKVEEI